MAGDDTCLVGESEKPGSDGVENLLEVASGEVCAANASREKGVAGEDHFERNEVEADGALGMPGGVNDQGWVGIEANLLSVEKALVRGCSVWRGDAEPFGLLIHHLEQREVVFVEENGGACEVLQFECPSDVVDVSVGDENLFEFETESRQTVVDAADFVARIDDDGFPRCFVAEECAVALQRADRKGLENHAVILGEEESHRQQTKTAVRKGTAVQRLTCDAHPETICRTWPEPIRALCPRALSGCGCCRVHKEWSTRTTCT